MTTKQYYRAIQILERIKDLEQVKKTISNTTRNRLTYEKDDEAYPSWAIRPIGNILDRHDKMIREEIDQEIEALTKEIEAL